MSDITTTGAKASWAAANGAASYDWEVVPAGSAQGVGVVASGSGETGLTASITGLTSGTPYDFLISSDCTYRLRICSFIHNKPLGVEIQLWCVMIMVQTN